MRTKTLLAAAATLAVSLATSMAQVYSQNIVGYYNVSIPAGKFQLIANQLINGSDANKTNNDVNAIFSGLVSDVNGVNNTVLYKWNGHGYGVYQYFIGADADAFNLTSGSVNGFYDTIGNLVAQNLNQSSGSFLYNPSGSAVTVTMVGTVPQTTNVVPIIAGFNIYSIYAPVSTNLESSATLAGFPGTSDINGVTNDVLYKWNGNGYGVYQYFTGADADAFNLTSGSVNGFYDSIGNLINSAPPVGQAFFLFHHGATVNWTNSLVVP